MYKYNGLANDLTIFNKIESETSIDVSDSFQLNSRRKVPFSI